MASLTDLARRACETHHFHASIGVDIITAEFCAAVRDEEHPDVWDRNRVFNMTAANTSEMDSVLRDETSLHAFTEKTLCDCFILC